LHVFRGMASRRYTYTLASGVLSAGMPIGLLAVRWARRRGLRWAPVRAMLDDLSVDAAGYRYLAVVTAAVFGTFGYLLGRKADELEARAETDALTGLYNARGLEARLSAEIARTTRYRAPLSVLLIDLDRLKEINDRYGHYAGQSALREVAAAIRAELRANDIAARWGGDEFVVVAPNTSTGAGWAMAERIRVAIGTTSTKWILTASIGMTTFEANDADCDADVETLIRSADAALYEAKRRGRNQVAMAQPLTRQEARRADRRHSHAAADPNAGKPVVSH
jgi:diguanylate cyclase (GGDEF)-like protein